MLLTISHQNVQVYYQVFKTSKITQIEAKGRHITKAITLVELIKQSDLNVKFEMHLEQELKLKINVI